MPRCSPLCWDLPLTQHVTGTQCSTVKLSKAFKKFCICRSSADAGFLFLKAWVSNESNFLVYFLLYYQSTNNSSPYENMVSYIFVSSCCVCYCRRLHHTQTQFQHFAKTKTKCKDSAHGALKMRQEVTESSLLK